MYEIHESSAREDVPSRKGDCKNKNKIYISVLYAIYARINHEHSDRSRWREREREICSRRTRQTTGKLNRSRNNERASIAGGLFSYLSSRCNDTESKPWSPSLSSISKTRTQKEMNCSFLTIPEEAERSHYDGRRA